MKYVFSILMLLSTNCVAVTVDNTLQINPSDARTDLVKYYTGVLDTPMISPPRESKLECKHYKENGGWYVYGTPNRSIGDLPLRHPLLLYVQWV